MALFFDQAWFDNELTRLGATRADLAVRLSLEPNELVEVFKDQRTLNRDQIETIAVFFGLTAEQIADKAGIATPRPSQGWTSPEERQKNRPPMAPNAELTQPYSADLVSLQAQVQLINDRLSRLETQVEHIIKNLAPKS